MYVYVCVCTHMYIYILALFSDPAEYHTLSHVKHVLATELQPSPDAVFVRFLPPPRDLEGIGNQNLDGRMGVSLVG